MNSSSLALRDITVVVDKGDQYNVSIRPSDNYNVSVTTGDQYIVNVMQPGAIRVDASGSYFSIADSALTAISASFAQTASYALNAAGAGSISSSQQIINLINNQIITPSQVTSSFTGSFTGDGSNLINVTNLAGGRENYVALWDTNTTLTSSLIYQTGSSIILNGTQTFYPQYPETLGIYNYTETSYNLIVGHGRIDNYIQFNIKNESSGSIASSDIVATADNGDEFEHYVNMGINSSQYTASFGGPNDAYFFSTGHKLLIGNASTSESILFFAGGYPQNDESLVKFRISPTDNHQLTGSLSITGDAFVNGTITANKLQVSTVVSSSIIYESGSTKFGDTLDDTHQFTGSLLVTGSNTVNGSLTVTGITNVTGSLYGTSSWAQNVVTASYTQNAETLDGLNSTVFATTGSNVFVGNQIISGSLITTADSMTFVGEMEVSGSLKVSGSLIATASVAIQAISASYIDGGYY